MRADARNLLERLGKQDFAYKEFTDRFSDLELWPAFEALLNDKRLFSGSAEPVLMADIARTPAVAASHPVAEATSHANIFAKYDEASRTRPSPASPRQPAETAGGPSLDVRGMLQQLNDLARNGDL